MLCVQALLLLAAAALPRGAAAAAAAVAITWMSEPTFPGETLLLHGAGFSSACALTLTPSPPTAAPVTLAALPGQASDASLKFALPLTLPPGALALALACPAAANYSHPALLNAASAWWFQGDVGSAATAGGWLRVLGPTLALQAPASQEAALLRGIRAARDALSAPSAAADAAWEEGSPMAAAAAQLLALRAQLASVRAAPSHLRATLRLTPLGGGGGGGAPLYLPAQADSLAPHSAAFALPPSLPLGEYAVAVANGAGADTDGGGGGGAGAGAFVPVAFFESAARPAVASIQVLAPRAWPPGVFLVDTPADPCSPLPCPTSDASLARALAQAQAAGGGTVLFPRGAYFLTAPVALPPNTVLAGTSREEVAVWFAEWSVASAPQDALFALNDTLARASAAPPAMGAAGAGSGLASWGLANFTLYLTAFHNEVIVTSNATDGFVLQGMRVRDNPFAFVWGTGPAMGSRGRVANFTTAQVGQLVDIHSVNNVITGNDLFGVNQILNSFASNGCCGRNSWPSWRRGHSYSRITDNVIYNGQSSHFMQLWRQILFERNVVRGSTTTAGGQSVGTGPMGGVAQHIYHADNTVHYTWGGDREVMTYDDAGGAYWGQLESVAGATLTLAGDAWPASDWCGTASPWGGAAALALSSPLTSCCYSHAHSMAPTGKWVAGRAGRCVIFLPLSTTGAANFAHCFPPPLPLPGSHYQWHWRAPVQAHHRARRECDALCHQQDVGGGPALCSAPRHHCRQRRGRSLLCADHALPRAQHLLPRHQRGQWPPPVLWPRSAEHHDAGAL